MIIGIKCPKQGEIPLDMCGYCEKPCLPRFETRALFDRIGYQRYGLHATILLDCLRRSFLEKKAVVYLPVPTLLSIYFGSLIHEPWGKYADEEEVLVGKRFGELEVVGFIDAIHDNVLYELKTTRGKIPGEPQERDMLQLQCYWSIVKDEHFELVPREEGKRGRIRKIVPGRKVEGLKLQYLSTTTAASRIFDVPMVDRSEFLEGRARQLVEALRSNRIPERALGEQCEWCMYREPCKRYEETKAWEEKALERNLEKSIEIVKSEKSG